MTFLDHLNPLIHRLPTYQPGRPIAEVARECNQSPKDIIKLASNENPLGPSPKALQAMRHALSSAHLYPDGHAFQLKSRLSEKLEVPPSRIILGNGSNEVIELIGHALLNASAEVIVSQYCFAIYPIVTRLFGASVKSVPAKNYAHDLPAMGAAITPRTRVLFVANPNNPTGTLAPHEAVFELVERTPAETLLVMDEAYFEYLDEPADLLSLVRNQDPPNLMILRTFSKIHGLAGLRVGYGIGHPSLIEALEKVRQPFNLNSIAQAAALAALEDTGHVARTRDTNRAGLVRLTRSLERLGLTSIPSFANFVLVRVGDGKQVFQALQARGIITRPMVGYGLPEWIRISVGTAEENARCLRGLEAVLR